jgi:opacity protein-like surface antigen
MRFILATAASLALCVTTATAGDWYASVYGGVNFDNVIDLPFVESETGQVIGGTIGRRTPVPGLRIEADLSYRTNDVEIFGGAIDVAHDTTALMFNVAYDIDVDGDPVKPYLLLGVGAARTQATFENVSLLRLEASGVAFQAGAGLNTAIWPGASLGLGYRFMQASTIEVLGTELSDGTNHSVVAQLTFDL